VANSGSVHGGDVVATAAIQFAEAQGIGALLALQGAVRKLVLDDVATVEQTLLAFGRRYEQIAQPFEWKFTRKDLNQLLERLEQPRPQHQLAA